MALYTLVKYGVIKDANHMNIYSDKEGIRIFETKDEAVKFLEKNPKKLDGYQICELKSGN